MRSYLALRLLLVGLLSALLLVGLIPRPAEANHVVWQGTLKLRQPISGQLGCHHSLNANTVCTGDGLTPRTFTFGGTSYGVDGLNFQVGTNPNQFFLRLTLSGTRNAAQKAAWQSLVLQIGNQQFNISERASRSVAVGRDQIDWQFDNAAAAPLVTWFNSLTVGGQISVSLIDTVPHTMVTRTLESGVEITMPVGKFYTVVHAETGEREGVAREADLVEISVVLGSTPDPNDPPQFTCNTRDGTAEAGTDYTAGPFPVEATAVITTFPLATKSEYGGANSSPNVWDPSETFEAVCLPDQSSGDWRPWRHSGFRVTILDQVESATVPTTFTDVTVTGYPQSRVAQGKFYSVGFEDAGGSTVKEGLAVEGNLVNVVVVLGETPPTGGVTFKCTTYEDTAVSDDYVGGTYPATAHVSIKGFGLPFVAKADTEVEIDEWFWVECVPTSGTGWDSWRAWPSPRGRIKIVDGTIQPGFVPVTYQVVEGATTDVQVVADSKGHRMVGARTVNLKVVATWIEGRGTASHPGDIRFSSTQARSVTETLGTSIGPHTLTVQAVDDNVCEGDEVAFVSLSEPSGADWATDGTILGGRSRASVVIVDNGEGLPAAPAAVAAAVNGTALAVEWLEPQCPYLAGVELEYKMTTETTWTSGLMAGREWDYDGDNDPSNNRQLTTSHTVSGLPSGLEADTKYNVRVRYRTAAGAGEWKNTISGEAVILGGNLPTTSPPPPPTGGGGGPTGGGGGSTGGGGGSTGGGGGSTGSDQGEGGDELPPGAAELFEDVTAGVRYESALSWMVLHRITLGCAPTRFCPDQNLTREQFVTFLWRAAGRPVSDFSGSEAFADVAEGVYSDQAIGWAVSNRITLGCTAGAFGDADWRFCPSDPVTRGQMATLLHRHTEADHTGQSSVYTDVTPDDYYSEAVIWLTDFGVVPGCDPTRFCPHRDATRAEAALFIHGVAIRPHIWGEGNNAFILQS
jgi:hypothetical protein